MIKHSLTDICVVARTKKLVDDYIALFTRAGIRSYAIKRNKVDDRSFDGLRVATMHRVKGLEFKYVFIAAVNNRIIPLPFAINKTDAVSEVESITSEKCLLYIAWDSDCLFFCLTYEVDFIAEVFLCAMILFGDVGAQPAASFLLKFL